MDAVNAIMTILGYLVVFMVLLFYLCVLCIWIFALLTAAWFTPSWARYWVTYRAVLKLIDDEIQNNLKH